MQKHQRPSRPVPASKVGRAAFCPHAIYLEQTGAPKSRDALARQERGNQQHEQFNAQLIAQAQRVPATAQRSGCFIATAVYGEHHPTTQQFRRFRDRTLRRHRTGRWFTQLYYQVSPHLVPLLLRHPRLAGCVRALLDRLAQRLPSSAKER